jgi:hypothetical protein
MKIGIISTFPALGSRNIGDLLISCATEDALASIAPESTIYRFYRGDSYSNIAELVGGLDHIVFACLAVRERFMFDKLYPYARQIQACGVPYTILSAGTELGMGRAVLADWSGSAADRASLLSLLDGAVGVSTRGVLTQQFLSRLGAQCEFLGDIAFLSPQCTGTPFPVGRQIRSILISDPHYWADFYPALLALHRGLRSRFADASIKVVLHGKSGLRQQLDADGIEYVPIYEGGIEALDIYGTSDLHVGFRVHGHVSALKRRVYSYLLEQDGRGADYGAAVLANIAVPCHLARRGSLGRLRRHLNKVALQFGRKQPNETPTAVYRILAMIDSDRSQGFARFSGLHQQIDDFNANNLAFLRDSLERGKRIKPVKT